MLTVQWHIRINCNLYLSPLWLTNDDQGYITLPIKSLYHLHHPEIEIRNRPVTIWDAMTDRKVSFKRWMQNIGSCSSNVWTLDGLQLIQYCIIWGTCLIKRWHYLFTFRSILVSNMKANKWNIHLRRMHVYVYYIIKRFNILSC